MAAAQLKALKKIAGLDVMRDSYPEVMQLMTMMMMGALSSSWVLVSGMI
jgi:hypothetical protein